MKNQKTLKDKYFLEIFRREYKGKGTRSILYNLNSHGLEEVENAKKTGKSLISLIEKEGHGIKKITVRTANVRMYKEDKKKSQQKTTIPDEIGNCEEIPKDELKRYLEILTKKFPDTRFNIGGTYRFKKSGL